MTRMPGERRPRRPEGVCGGRPAPGLYVHIPFCLSKCRYCDFNSFSGLEWLIPRYAAALARELELWTKTGSPEVRSNPLGTAYFGGGTPTLLGAANLASVLKAARSGFGFIAGAEVTVETNPGASSEAGLTVLRRSGFNRLSLGIQSFNEAELRLLGRVHGVEQAGLAWSAGRRAGFDNMSLDLMYGLPGQALSGWRDNLERALELGPEHLSLYALSLEEGTPLAKAVACGDTPEPDPDLAAEMYSLAGELLQAGGYSHYEISNWARPGKECRHNLNYWRNGYYLGVGAGAHSHVSSRRMCNVGLPLQYVEFLERGGGGPAVGADDFAGALRAAGLPVGFAERIDERTAMAETMMLGLRLAEGVDERLFRRRHGAGPGEVYGPRIEELIAQGLLERHGKAVRLTPRGRLLGNQAFCRFFE